MLSTIYWFEGNYSKSIETWKECWKAEETVYTNYGYASSFLLVDDDSKVKMGERRRDNKLLNNVWREIILIFIN